MNFLNIWNRRKHQFYGKRRTPIQFVQAEVLESRTLLTGTVVPGLVAVWNFDEGPDWHDAPFHSVATAFVANDSVGDHPADLINMPSSAWVSGQQFTGVAFDGVDDYLRVQGDLGTVLGGNTSLLFWIKTAQIGDLSPALAPSIVGNDGIQFGGIDAAGRLGISVGQSWIVQSATPINDNEWHFVVLTRDAATGVSQIYVDGQISAAGSGPAGDITGLMTSIAHADRVADPAVSFAGRLDQISLFDRVVDASTVLQWRENYAPKTWSIRSEGVTGAPFTTTSVFYHAFDSEDDPLRIVRFTQGRHGTVVDNSDGTFLYTPNSGFVGNDEFDVIIEDGRGGFSRTTVFLDVVPEPVGRGDMFTTRFEMIEPLQAGGSAIAFANPWRVPRATDWDGDGKTDLLVSADNFVWLYRNIGTSQTPEFDSAVKVQAAGSPIFHEGAVTSITLADLTGDGIQDLVLTDETYKLQLYINQSPSDQVPLYSAPVRLLSETGADLILENPRFDLGDWNNDGLLDVILGTFGGDVTVRLNTGSVTQPRFSSNVTVAWQEAHNFYPRWIDLSGNGIFDLVRGINWGDIRYWLDPTRQSGDLGRSTSGYLTTLAPDLSVPPFHQLTDGPVVDFADFNADGVLDLVIGGQLAGANLFFGLGKAKSFTDYISELEAIYDAHPNDLGSALEADGQTLLRQVQDLTRGLITRVQSASPAVREAMATTFAAHIEKYAFLRSIPLDTAVMHHVPSLVAQDILIAGHIRTDTPDNRVEVANLFEMSGLRREIYLKYRYVIGDNLQASQGQLESLQSFLRWHPHESYPDELLTIDNFWGDGPGAIVDAFGSSKNTFGNDTGWAVDEWADDLRASILAVKPDNPTTGDLFTFVVGHEATHSLDAYVRSRSNSDLARRWGQYLVLAGGPDVVAGSDGFLHLAATQQRFQSRGYWDGQPESWSSAWQSYWSTGPGAAIQGVNNLRGNIQFLLENPQESLATQGNQHWVDSEARIIGAIDRYRRGITPDLTEALTFLDFISVGMNRVPMFDIDVNATTNRADWSVSYANLERDDLGRITRVSMSNGREYRFRVDDQGVYSLPSIPPEEDLLSIEAAEASKFEGSSGMSSFTFLVTRSGSEETSARVKYHVIGDGPHPADAADFGGMFPEGELIFEPGQSLIVLTVQIQGDGFLEEDESFRVTLSDPSAGNVLGQATAFGAIRNDDLAAVIAWPSGQTIFQMNQKNIPALIEPSAVLTFGIPNPNLAGSKLVVSLTANRTSKDVLGFLSGPSTGVHTKGKKLLSGKSVIGTVTGGKGRTADLTIAFTASASADLAQKALTKISFATKNSGQGPRTVQVRLVNVNGSNSNTVTRQISIE